MTAALVVDPRLSRDVRLDIVDAVLKADYYGYVILWSRDVFGTVGTGDKGGQFILNGLNQSVDAFVATYLRMGGDDCP